MNLPQASLDKIKRLLLHQQKKVEDDLKAIEKDDPILNEGLAESSEPGIDSWMADIHTRVMSTKQTLVGLLTRTKQALTNINSGKYGKCDNCGKVIDEKRLQAMPTATRCIACSKKPAK